MPFCFFFKNYFNFPNLTGKTYIFTNPKNWLFFFKKKFIFSFILSRDPNEQLCKVSASLNKNLVFFEKSQNAFFTFFEGPKNRALERKQILDFIFYVLEPRWTIVPNLLHFGWNFKHRPLILPTLSFLCVKILYIFLKSDIRVWNPAGQRSGEKNYDIWCK